jgi:hypothetical protein
MGWQMAVSVEKRIETNDFLTILTVLTAREKGDYFIHFF